MSEVINAEGLWNVPEIGVELTVMGSVPAPMDDTLTLAEHAAGAEATGEELANAAAGVTDLEDALAGGLVKSTPQTLTQAQKVQVGKNIGLFELIYPVGSVYMTMENTSPATLFPGTVWTQIKGRFLLGAGSNTPGQTGGSASYNYTPVGTVGNTALTASQTGLPAHAHTHDIRIPDHTHDFRKIDVSTSTVRTAYGRFQPIGGGLPVNSMEGSGQPTSGYILGVMTYGSVGTPNTNPTCGGVIKESGDQGATEGHSHTFSGSGSIQIMPPYMIVYMWQRTQ